MTRVEEIAREALRRKVGWPTGQEKGGRRACGRVNQDELEMGTQDRLAQTYRVWVLSIMRHHQSFEERRDLFRSMASAQTMASRQWQWMREAAGWPVEQHRGEMVVSAAGVCTNSYTKTEGK